MTERQSEELRLAEEAVLGSLMRDNQVIPDVLELVGKDDFYHAARQIVFAAAVALWQAGKPVDPVTLADALKDQGAIQDIGGYVYLAKLWEATPTAALGAHYAAIVRDRSLLRKLSRAAARIQEYAEKPTGPAEEMLEQAEREVFALAEVGVQGGTMSLAEAVNLCLDRLDARKTRKATAGAVLTGFLDLDELMCGLQPAELILLAARPSTGKTALSLAITRNAALEGHPVFFASLEQPGVDLAERLLSREAQVDGYKMRKGYVGEDDYVRIDPAVLALRALPVRIDQSPRQSVLRIAANVRRMKHAQGLGLVVVDYLQLIDPEDRRVPRHEQVATVSRRLKHLAREANVPVLCLAQLNREVEQRKGERPRLADLRDSGELEQNADAVLLLHRPEPGAPGEVSNVIEVILAKQRNGPTGEVNLVFHKEHMRFENFAVEPGVWPS